MNGHEAESPTTDIERLQRYSRYAALVAEQLEALRSGDLDRLRRLNVERMLLQGEDDWPEGEAGESKPLSDLHDVLRSGIDELEERFDGRRRVDERLSLISAGALRTARELPVTPTRRRRYPEISARQSRVDLRF